MMKENEVPVWDIFVRVFHWALAAGFFVAYFTEEELMSVHTFAGYSVLLLVGLRLIWGFIGTRHARFTDFVKRPSEVKAYLKDIFSFRARRYLGHNPAGGAMIVLMLIALIITGMSGMATYAAEEGLGPLAGLIAKGTGGELFEEVHEIFANFTLLLVVIHVGGVLLESLLHRENLVRAMLTGRKAKHVN